jgi:membrane-associated PAP2 superfamily phosphatase
MAPLAALALLTALFRWTPADVAIARCFFDAEQRIWPGLSSELCLLIYQCGIVPPFIVAIVGGLWALAALLRQRTWTAMQAGVFLVALFVIAPGLIVNQGFKLAWGRPRPHQLKEFGGLHDFVPVGQPGTWPRHNSSFPSGHAAVAFYLIAPAFLVSARRRRLALAWMTGGLAFGAGVGSVRVIQGSHFVSDVVWAAAIVYFTGVLLAHALLRPARSTTAAAAPEPALRRAA